MPIDETPNAGTAGDKGSSSTDKLLVVFAILVLLAVGEIYGLAKLNSLNQSLEQAQASLNAKAKEFGDQVSKKFTDLENSNAQVLDGLKRQIDQTGQKVGSTGKQLRQARATITQLQKQSEDQTNELKQEISQKADDQKVGELAQNVSSTRSDLDSAKQLLDTTRNDLGMARSEFGTLIARNHDDIEQLRRMGERDYFEFTLDRKKPQRVAGVGLTLKSANVKRHRFNVVMDADDMQVEKKDRTVNEPIFFSVGNSKTFYEMVVNQVQSGQVKGYISTPKGATEMASRSEGGR